MAVKFKDTININGQYTLPLTDGSDGQVLVTDGAGNLTFSSESIAGSADSAESTHLNVKNTSGASIAKGTPVYVTGNVGNTDKLEIAPADASNASHMPAIGLLESTLADNGEGFVVQGGLLKGLVTDTIDGSSSTANDTVYVKAGGGLTLTKPTGSTNFIQNIAKVARVHSSNGSLIVSSILRTNDVPNLSTGKIWVGDSNTIESTVVHIDEPNGRVGIGTDSPTELLTLNATTGASLQWQFNAGNYLRIEADAGGGSYYAAAGLYHRFFTSGAERMKISSGGDISFRDTSANEAFYWDASTARLGIGTTSPSKLLHIHSGDSGGVANIAADDVLVEGSGDTGITISSPSTNIGTLAFGDNDISLRGAIRYDHSDDSMLFRISSNTRMMIDSSGNVGIGTTSPNYRFHAYHATTNVVGQFHSGDNQAWVSVRDDGYTTYGAMLGCDSDANLSIILADNSANKRLVINESGNVGIGTTSPSQLLDIIGNSATVKVSESGGSEVRLGAGGSIGRVGTYSNHPMTFLTNSTERMRITSAGAVGINGNNYLYAFPSTSNTGFIGSGFSLNGASNSMLLWTNNTQRMSITSGGSVAANVDMRAPIFYDSDNTGYYVDPAGSSNMASIALNGSSYSSGIDSVTDAALIIDRGLKIYNDDGNYLRSILQFDTSAQINVGQGGTALISSVNLLPGNAGYVYAANSFRAPIFYDSDDTGYYSDQASTSRLNALNTYGPIMSGDTYTDPDVVLAIHEYDTSESIRDKFKTTSTNVTRQIDGTAPAGGCFQVSGALNTDGFTPFYKIDDNQEYTFEVWIKWISGTDNDSRLYAGSRFYDSNRTYLGNSQRYWASPGTQFDANTNNSGWYHVSGTLGPSRGSSNGNIPTSAEYMRLLFLFNYNGGDTVTRYCGLKVFKSDKTITSLYRKSLTTQFGTSENRNLVIDNNGDIYGTKFIDTNSSTYFMDMQGGGKVTGNFEFAANTTSTSYQYASIELRESNYTANSSATPPFIGFHWGGVVASSIRLESNGTIAIVDNPGTDYEDFKAAIMTSTVDMRAPIFYDSDNTNWYTNPASTSITDPSGKFAQYVQIGDSATYNSNDGGWGARLNVTDNIHAKIDVAQDADSMRSTWYAHTGHSGPIFGTQTAHPMRMMYSGSEVGFWDDTKLQHDSSLRAPIFYDSGNTGYYVDPGGTSKLYKVTTNNSQDRVKLGVWDSTTTYGMGMMNGFTFGPLNNNYAMTFEMNNDSGRGFWWGDDSHTNAQGAMALTTDGRLTVARSLRVGYGESDTTSLASGMQVSGDINATGDVVASCTSDGRLKDNKKNIENALEKVESLNGVEFDWNDKQDVYEGHDIGVIAQEVEKVLPEIVNTRDNGYKAVKYEKLVPLLIEAIKELSNEIKELKNK